jgi:hypothetical protein
MEPIVSTVFAFPGLGSFIGFVFAALLIAGLIALAIQAGLNYSIPRLLVKALGQCAMSRLS